MSSALTPSLLRRQCPSLDSPALDLTADDVDRVLRHYDEIICHLVYLLNETGKLVGRLDEHFLLRLTVLTHVRLASRGVGEIVEVNGLILGHGKLTCLQEGGGIR